MENAIYCVHIEFSIYTLYSELWNVDRPTIRSHKRKAKWFFLLSIGHAVDAIIRDKSNFQCRHSSPHAPAEKQLPMKMSWLQSIEHRLNFSKQHTKIKHFFSQFTAPLAVWHKHPQVDGEDETKRRRTVRPRCRFHIHKIFRPNRRAVSLLFEFIFYLFAILFSVCAVSN